MMMQRLMALSLVATVGCGTVLNAKTVTVYPPPGGAIDGVGGPLRVNQQGSHIITYPNGSQCLMNGGISVGYLVVDIVLLFLIGVVVDAVTGGWTVLDANACPGVQIVE